MILIVPSAVRDILKDYGSKPEIWDPTLLDSARSIFNNWVLDISQHDFSKPKTKKIVLVIGSPVESFCTKIVQKLRKDLLTFQVKIARNFDVFAHWCLNFVFMRNFVKKNYLFRMNAQFRAKLFSYWYENDANFRAKKSFRAKTRNCYARELTVSWKPYLVNIFDQI